MIPLIGFAPDADPTTAGVLTSCGNVIPFEGGLKGAPSPVTVGADTLAAACRGAVSTTDLSGTKRVYAGTSANLYELSGATWTSRSRGGGYSLGSEDRWSFVQYANATLAATPSAVIQRSTGAAFADVAGSPQAKFIEAAQGFAIALNTSSYADEWYCSAYLDDTNWTLSVSNQCVKGRLVGGSGPITAARRFGDDVIAYKSGAMHRGTYVGAPAVWQWQQVSTDVGAVGPEAVADTPFGHLIVSRENVYMYDGTTPRPVATGLVRRWLFADMSATYNYRVIVQWDRPNGLVWIYYPSAGGGGVIDRCVVYHPQTQRWGVANQSIEAAVMFTSPSITYTSGSPLITTYDASPSIPYDSLFWMSGAQTPAVFNTSHVLSTMSGICGDSWFYTGDMGDDQGSTFCDALRVRYTEAPTTASATGFTKAAEGDQLTQGPTASIADGKFAIRQAGRWHRFLVSQTGDFSMTAVRPSFKNVGAR